MSAPGRDGGRKGLREPVPALALVIVPAAIRRSKAVGHSKRALVSAKRLLSMVSSQIVKSALNSPRVAAVGATKSHSAVLP